MMMLLGLDSFNARVEVEKIGTGIKKLRAESHSQRHIRRGSTSDAGEKFCRQSVAVLALQNCGCNAPKPLWPSRLPIPYI